MDFLQVIKIIFYGIVEGITEWLPISSTGHLILFDEFFGLNLSKDFKDMFMVVIQLGAIMAVVVLYWKKLWPFTTKKEDYYINTKTMRLWVKVLIATIPSIIIGLPLNDWMEEHLLNSSVVAAMLILYGILFIIMENHNKSLKPRVNTIGQLSFKTAAFIGAFQVLAMVPGTSRSGATILGAIILGCSRPLAAEFSFYLAIPTMFGASLLKLVKFGLHYTTTEVITLLLGMVVAFVVSIVVIKFLMNFVKKHDFKVFGYYRIVLGIFVILYGIIVGYKLV